MGDDSLRNEGEERDHGCVQGDLKSGMISFLTII